MYSQLLLPIYIANKVISSTLRNKYGNCLLQHEYEYCTLYGSFPSELS